MGVLSTESPPSRSNLFIMSGTSRDGDCEAIDASRSFHHDKPAFPERKLAIKPRMS